MQNNVYMSGEGNPPCMCVGTRLLGRMLVAPCGDPSGAHCKFLLLQLLAPLALLAPMGVPGSAAIFHFHHVNLKVLDVLCFKCIAYAHSKVFMTTRLDTVAGCQEALTEAFIFFRLPQG